MAGTCLMSYVNRIRPCRILALAPPLVASDFVSATHFFPVASRTAGLAGTVWSTSVQIVNPQTETLSITARLSSGGSFTTETLVIPAGETHSWPDFLGDVFAAEGNGALFFEAEAAANQNRPPERRAFAVSMRISTEDDDGGSFGQGVPSLDPVAGFLGDWTAYFPAVALSGQPGGNGFRTNVGFWNIGADDALLKLTLLDASGAEVWQQFVTAHRHDPFVMSLPRDLQLETATLVVETLGEWLDCAVYISVVDNTTGDASFQTSQLMDPDSTAAFEGGDFGEPDAHAPEQGPEKLRALFLGGVR